MTVLKQTSFNSFNNNDDNTTTKSANLLDRFHLSSQQEIERRLALLRMPVTSPTMQSLHHLQPLHTLSFHPPRPVRLLRTITTPPCLPLPQIRAALLWRASFGHGHSAERCSCVKKKQSQPLKCTKNKPRNACYHH
jgi:hypothetical protein